MCTCSNQLQPHDRLPNVCPPLPCLKADFPGDTCEFWVVNYQQDRCSNCEENQRVS